MAKRKKVLPNEILVYQCDEVDGVAIYCVAINVDEIPEEYDGETVGVFVLNHTNVFRLKRELA